MSSETSQDDYTLEVVLSDMPRGWVCFAIGEGKPVIAPPPVAEEIKRLANTARGLSIFEAAGHVQVRLPRQGERP